MAKPVYKSRVVGACDGCRRGFSEPAIQAQAPFSADGKPLDPVYCDRCEEAAILSGGGDHEEDAATPDRLAALSDALMDLLNQVTTVENDLRRTGKSLFVGRKNLETAYRNAALIVSEERE